jgi:hypothetical protein
MTPTRRGLLLAVLLSALVIAAREVEFFDVAYDRFHLPAFDGHVYVAMTEAPGFFSVAPWGYRVLNPWLIRLSTYASRDHVPAFFWSTVLGLGLGGVLLFLYLKRLGHATLPALLALTLYGVSRPVGEAVRYQFLAEPLTFLLEMAFLFCLEAAAPLGLLALIGILGVLAKEFFLCFLPLVWLVRRGREGDRRALVATALVAIPVLLVAGALRHDWTPHIHPPLPSLSIESLSLVAARVAESWAEWRTAPLLMGVTPLAVVGALRRAGRRLAARGAYLFAVTLVTPLLNPVNFVSDDIPRLLLYAIPGVMPLALAALDGILPRDEPVELQRSGRPRRLGPAAAALAAVVGLMPFAVVDRYRRVDLLGERDAMVTLAVLRGSLQAAKALDSGDAFVFDADAGRYAAAVPNVHDLMAIRQVRWFLREGWGPSAARQGGEPMMASQNAGLLLPCLERTDLMAELTLMIPRETSLTVSVNDRRVAERRLAAGSQRLAVRISGALLFRGDNDLELRAEGPQPEIRLRRFSIRSASARPSGGGA